MTTPTTSPELDAALAVVKRLRGAGHEAYFAGGSVRDGVMGLTPKDYDVTTSAIPEEVLGLFERCLEVGAQFGVIVVLVAEHQIEVATFRTETGYADGRRPDQVTWATAREDVLRRDFTINGLLADPMNEDPTARIIDHVGGVDDIHAGLIRAIGDPARRFEEDQLRLLRALRFAARLAFTIEPATWAAVQAHAATIVSVSVERIRDELQRLLTEGGARRGWVSLMSSGMMPHVLPEPSDLERVRDRLTDERMPPEEAWATVLLEVANPDVVIAAWGQRLRMPKALSRHVSQAVNIAMKLLGYSELTTAQRKRLLRRAESETACRVATRAVAAGQRAGEALETAQADAARWTAAELWPPQLISGDTLVASGHRPGPGFKRALDAVEDAQLEGQVDDEAQALALALATLER